MRSRKGDPRVKSDLKCSWLVRLSDWCCLSPREGKAEQDKSQKGRSRGHLSGAAFEILRIDAEYLSGEV